MPRVTSDEQKITGVSFKKQGRRISGSRIHRDYAWPQLERHLGWDHARDYARLQRVPEPVPTSSEDENQSDEASDSGSMREDLRVPSFPPVERISEPEISPDLPASRPKKSRSSSSSDEPVPHTKSPHLRPFLRPRVPPGGPRRAKFGQIFPPHLQRFRHENERVHAYDVCLNVRPRVRVGRAGPRT